MTGGACKMQWVKLILQEILLRRRVLVVFPGMAEKYISKYKYSGMADKVYSAVFPLTLSFTQISNLLTHTN